MATTARARRAAISPWRVRSLQSQQLAAGQQADRLLQTPAFRLLALGGLDPGEVTPAVRERQRLEVAPGRRVLPQRGPDVGRQLRRQLEARRARGIAALGGRTLDPRPLQSPCGSQLGVTPAV